MDFETLCLNLFNIKKPFKKNGSLSVTGTKAYGKLLSLFYDMKDMKILSNNPEKMILKLDKVISKEGINYKA